jgi:ketopantoate reductase
MRQIRTAIAAVAVFSVLAGGVTSVAFAKGDGHVQETIKHAKEGIAHEKEAIKHLEEAIQGSDNPHAKHSSMPRNR